MSMRTLILGVFAAVALSPGMVQAQDAAPTPTDHNPPGHCPDGRCRPETRETCFNLVCYYKNPHNPEGYKNCKVSAKFDKRVTLGGGEVSDDSSQRNNPEFEVQCDNSIIFNNSARRFTDALGTRIQGETGPHPAITLPRGELHTGADGTSGDHVSPSILELDIDSYQLRTEGSCYIWSGTP